MGDKKKKPEKKPDLTVGIIPVELREFTKHQFVDVTMEDGKILRIMWKNKLVEDDIDELAKAAGYLDDEVDELEAEEDEEDEDVDEDEDEDDDA